MSPYEQILHLALQTPFGLIVTHEHPPTAKANLAIAAQGKPEFAGISFTILKEHPDRVYIVTCPEERANLLSASMSGSSSPTSSGSEPTTGLDSDKPDSFES